MAGRVFEKSSRTAISGVTVSAQLITTNERFSGSPTDGRGSYLISNVPAGIYAFYLDYQGMEYTVAERFDVRTGVDFLLESCFELDTVSKKAVLLQECKSGLYSETQVVSLGPHRFYRPASSPLLQEVAEESLGQTDLTVTHAGVECIIADQFPQLSAFIEPTERVQSCRIYFRAAQHADFYYVEMQPVEDYFMAILPKPSPETEMVIYYIEAVDLDFGSAQTQEHDPEVTDEETCKRRDPGAAYFTGEDPGIVVGSTVAGIAAVPAGFQAAGIAGFISATGVVTAAAVGAAAGAGIGATGVVLIVAGATAGAVGIGTAVTGEDEASPPR
jgi:hypothetical protein